MHKKDIILLHLVLFNFMRMIEEFLKEKKIKIDYFQEYYGLGISPVLIHKDKAEHKKACIFLAEGILKFLEDNLMDETSRKLKAKLILLSQKSPLQKQ